MRLWLEKVRPKKSVVLLLDCVWPEALSLRFRVLHLTKQITVQLLDTNSCLSDVGEPAVRSYEREDLSGF